VTERPTTVEEWEAAVRGMVGDYRAAAKFDHKSDEELSLLTRTADRLAALLPSPKERVPWWEAKGRTVDARVVTRATDEAGGPGVWVRDSESMSPVLSERHVHADPDGMVEVDAR